MDSFDQNATVKVNELQAVYNDMQRRCIELDKKYNDLEIMMKINQHNCEDIIKKLKNDLNSITIWQIIKNKFQHKPIC